MKSVVIAVVLLSVLLFATAKTPVIFGSRAPHNAPRPWTLGPRAHPAQRVTFHLALKQRNLDVLENLFWAVSTPGSPQYREFMSISDIQAITAPADEDVARVLSWLHANGINKEEIENYGDSLFVKTKANIAEKLLNTRFHYWKNEKTGKSIVRIVDTFGVDAEVAPYIDMITGITEYPITRPSVKRAKSSADIPNTLVSIAPQSVNTIYKVPANAKVTGNSSIAVAEWEAQSYSPDELSAFAKQFSVNIPALSNDHIVGQNDPNNPGVEATLDIQYAAALSPGAADWFWLEDNSAWLYTFATHVVATSPAPYIYSISYGWSEADQCENGIGGQECNQLGVNSQQYVQRVNTEFQKIGLRGISLFSASGDSGANGRTDPFCRDNKLHPDFPGSSPYITSVGATQITQSSGVANLPNPPAGCSGRSCASGGIEVAVSFDQANFASGGGFSEVAATPSYQKAAVNDYLTKASNLPPSSMYNAKGRGYPDVAAFGSNVLIYTGGYVQGVGGTSASCPIVAALFAIINDQVITKTGKPLGFLNPFIYQMAAKQPDAFTDIVVGDNKCTEDGCASSCQGFTCSKGWDPVTGLGTPVFKNIQSYAASLFNYEL